ncbi:MAG: hypothetical protein ACXVVQ_06585 [Solirubrobacteraceae bacterium]
MADAGEHLLAGIREYVYRRSTPLATHTLVIGRSSAGEGAGVIGATALCIDHMIRQVPSRRASARPPEPAGMLMRRVRAPHLRAC